MNSTLNSLRYAIYVAIAVIIFLLLRQWVTFSAEYDKLAEQRNIQNTQSISPATETLITNQQVEALGYTDTDNNIPAIANTSAATSIESNNEIKNTSNSVVNNARYITVKTDIAEIKIDKLGGDIIEYALLEHLTTLDADSAPLKLLEKNKQRTYVAQSGIIGESGTNNRAARAFFSSVKDEYQMANGPLTVSLSYKDPNGITLTKNFDFTPNNYLLTVSYLIDNQSDGVWQGTFYANIKRDNSEDPGAESSGFGMQSYLGMATTTEDDPYKKIDFDEIAKKNFRHSTQGGWIATIQHYFVSAWVPNQDTTHHYYTKRANDGLNIIGFYSNPTDVQPGEAKTISAQFYAGPKNQYTLRKIANHLDLTVDYGWFWWLSQPLYTLLNFFATGDLHIGDNTYHLFSGVHNWGVAIILLTVVVKLLFFKLSATSYRSMANMRRVQPKLLAIRERYANDKQGQSKAMMELYQKEKINPLGGCLPILIQMPVFIALYWALIESVELRHAPFFLWINDLSAMDPYFILPILMGVSMFLQQKMNPAPPDPMQAKVMQLMPIIFTFFFLWFPAGLVIYWVSNNVLSILQQWVITRSIENADAAAK